MKKQTNKALNQMLETIEQAKKVKQKSVSVFTTNRSHHKATLSGQGVGVNDLKPMYKEAYNHLLVNFNVDTKLVNMGDYAVEWIVKL
jgi:hypothetical protein